MQLIEHSILLGYVVAADFERSIVLYYTANATFSNEIIDALRSQFYGWGILLCDELLKAKSIVNSNEIAQVMDCVAAENI